ncbi:hypothetical protein V2V72_07740 [Streptococcus agalactiae]
MDKETIILLALIIFLLGIMGWLSYFLERYMKNEYKKVFEKYSQLYIDSLSDKMELISEISKLKSEKEELIERGSKCLNNL